MNLYEIDERLMYAVEHGFDSETGEIVEGTDLEALINEVEMQLDTKLENIACFIKNLKADAEALKQEKLNLAQRQKVVENKAERLQNYLSTFLQAKEIPKFETPKCKVSFRKSTTVNITDEKKIPKKYLTVVKETKIDKNELKKYLKTNECEGANLVENQNIQIK